MSSEAQRNVRIHHRLTLLAPLSHIAETISTTTYLVEEPIIQPDGTVAKVFCYSGNAWRGQVRDNNAVYLLDYTEISPVSLEFFHLMFSGGSISGGQTTDLHKARAVRDRLIPIALMGGGLGNQILPGKMRVSNFYAVCQEAPRGGYDWPGSKRDHISYADMTFEKEFSRKDDSKDPRYNRFLQQEPPPVVATGVVQQAWSLAETIEAGEKRRKQAESEPADDGVKTQMRMRSELLAAGSQLEGHVELLSVSEAEIGCYVAALQVFSRSPHIGGQAARGHGRVALETVMVDMDTGEVTDPFVTVSDSLSLSGVARNARDSYDAHLRQVYDTQLTETAPDIRALIGVA